MSTEDKLPQTFPLPDENILKHASLLPDLPEEDFSLREAPLQSFEEIQENLQNLWQDIEVVKVPLNSHISLSYISSENLKLVVQRLQNIEIWRQKRFMRIISEMQQADNKSEDYSSQIINEHVGYNYNILFLDFPRYLKSIFHPPTRRILESADLLYPQGTLMQWAFSALSGRRKKHEQKFELANKFDFTVSLLSHLDECHCSIFLVGGVGALLAKVEKIFKTSFHNIKILGRYTENYRKGKLVNEVRTVINKSAPTLLLVAEKARIEDFIDGERKLKSFLVVDYPEGLYDFSGRYYRKKLNLGSFILSLRYLIFPWLWIKLLCIFIFTLKILCLKIGNKKILKQVHGK